MAFETHGRPCKAQDRILKSTCSTLFGLLSLFGSLNKLVNAQALLSRPFNVLVVAFAGFGTLPKIYSNKNIQDII